VVPRKERGGKLMEIERADIAGIMKLVEYVRSSEDPLIYY
jgi:predicted AAA+ superfamily ATPase